MEPEELFKIPYDIDLSSVDEQTLEEWAELQGLAKELAKSDELTKELIRINDAFAAGKQPEDIDFGFHGTNAGEVNGSCEEVCYQQHDLAWGKLHRDMHIGNLGCGGAGLLGLLGGPWTALGTFALCETLLWLYYFDEVEYLSDTLDLCLMGCEIAANP